MTFLFFFRCNNKSDNKYKCWNMVLLKKKKYKIHQIYQ